MSLSLHARAGALAGALPPLLAQAQMLAASLPGEHGRRRAGRGDEFWQYRAAHAGDPARAIDWRRSARSDALFVREREWQAAQAVTLWVDRGASMVYSGSSGRPEKGERARLLALALALLLLRGGERVGLAGGPLRSSRAQGERLAAALAEGTREHETPVLNADGRAVLMSDFLGPEGPVHDAILRAADRGVRGAVMQILDPEEEAFPFSGRVIFRSMGGGVSHETRQAADLRARYLERLNGRRARLAALCRRIGWDFATHHTDRTASAGLLWLYGALGGGR